MLKLNVTKICSIENCRKKVFGRGWCTTHWRRWSRHGDPLTVKQFHNDPERRFWSQVNKAEGLGPHGDCWEWTGYNYQGGYGQIYVDGRLQLTHRYAYFLAYGEYPQPTGRHTCDNPACVKAEHIIAGTQAENMADMVSRNRQAKGERHGNWKGGKNIGKDSNTTLSRINL